MAEQDILERLRKAESRVNKWGYATGSPLCKEAAGEIERLKVSNAELVVALQDAVTVCPRCSGSGVIERLFCTRIRRTDCDCCTSWRAAIEKAKP